VKKWKWKNGIINNLFTTNNQYKRKNTGAGWESIIVAFYVITVSCCMFSGSRPESPAHTSSSTPLSVPRRQSVKPVAEARLVLLELLLYLL